MATPESRSPRALSGGRVLHRVYRTRERTLPNGGAERTGLGVAQITSNEGRGPKGPSRSVRMTAIDGSSFIALSMTSTKDLPPSRRNLHLRTSDIRRPWESYRQSFHAPNEWTTVFLPFTDFELHRTQRSFKRSRLRRLGVVAIGQEFEADISIGDIRFYAVAASHKEF